MKKFFISKARRTRDTPYTNRIEAQGLTSYTVYNHMLLPTGFGLLEESYFHLKEHVQIWDVSGQRQVQITGKDSAKYFGEGKSKYLFKIQENIMKKVEARRVKCAEYPSIS